MWQVLNAAVAICMEYKGRLKMSVSIADKRPIADGPQVNGLRCEYKSCPATSLMARDLERAETINQDSERFPNPE